MTKAERENWIINIENVAAQVEELYGSESVDFVLGKVNANSIDELSNGDLSDVFSELYLMAEDK